jgi:hypothetical protein
VAEEEAIRIVKLRQPTECALWEHPERINGKFGEFLEEVEAYEDTSHLTRSLYKCRECGQLYFHEWYEWVDWDEGNDKQYSPWFLFKRRKKLQHLNERARSRL